LSFSTTFRTSFRIAAELRKEPSVGVSNGPTLRLDATVVKAARRTLNGPQGGLYVSRAARKRPGRQGRVDRLRELARAGKLAATAAEACGYDRLELTGAAYEVVWPIVFDRLTRKFERLRGHAACAAGVANLADDCLDRFHDDVEAVVDDLLAHAKQPILNLEAWIASRLGAATVDAYRRRRGSRGALQRPRLPGWLAAELGQDRWLTTLATGILEWVGVSGTAGEDVWPLESWAQERGKATGDWQGSTPAVVEREVELILGVMRRRQAWYESFVERPLGAKQAPVAMTRPDGADSPLVLGDPDERVDSELQRLAADAMRAIDQRVARGEAADSTVVEVIRTVFGGMLTGTLDRAPHRCADPLGGVTGALSDQRRVNQIVATALDIVQRRDSA
jgi:hypothetical protein